MNTPKTILITGGAKRIGKAIATHLHQCGHHLLIHYRSSADAAMQLQATLNQQRPNSCDIIQGDLTDLNSINQICQTLLQTVRHVDVLINNASTFYPTPLATVDESQWDDLMTSNLKAPLFLAKALAPHLEQRQGCIINMIDIYANRPLAEHPIYCSAKAGLQTLTKALARDLAPNIRVNGIAPGAILWPENDAGETDQETLLKNIPLQRLGTPNDIANTVEFLVDKAPYITGQIITVDGGRSTLP